MALEFTKLFKGTDVISQVGNYGFYKLSTQSAGEGGGDVEVTPVTYGVKIALTNSNPETAVTYTDDAVDFTKSYMDFTNDKFEYGSWADKFPFNQIKPCILKNGVVTTYLNPNNYAEDVDGNPVDITTTCDGDVMIEIPKIYYYLHKDSSYQYIQISNTKVDDNYCCFAHTYKGAEKNKVYIGAYQSYYDGTKSRSVSGVQSTGSVSLNNWRNYAHNNGEGYETFYWNLLVLLQCLYIIQFKNRNSQRALGFGWSSINEYATNGDLNSKGLYYGTYSTGQTKFMGIEGIYGNRWQLIDGVYRSGTRLTIADITSPDMAFSGTGVGYLTVPGSFYNTTGYMSRISGDNYTGFFPIDGSGANTSYYCDECIVDGSYIVRFGGQQNAGASNGIFDLSVDMSAGKNSQSNTSRLAYCG